ncbi:MAG: hypothetical protein DCC52_05550 [Chloroflexi bacterium]|nr:MAG: hypothetical protein DCC52_05550 [Chloroflexota bacterium]
MFGVNASDAGVTSFGIEEIESLQGLMRYDFIVGSCRIEILDLRLRQWNSQSSDCIMSHSGRMESAQTCAQVKEDVCGANITYLTAYVKQKNLTFYTT